MSATELPLKGRFVVFIYPKPLSYGFDTKNATRKELYLRIQSLMGTQKMIPRQVKRPLYPMQLGGYLKLNILQMVTGPATSILKEYTAIDLPSGPILYIEEVGEELYIFVISPGANDGFLQLCNLI